MHKTPPSRPTATVRPNLNASLWVDFPSLHIGQPQAVNITVNDVTGRPIPSARVVCVVESRDFKQTIPLPLTNADGRTRLPIRVPRRSTPETYSVIATLVDTAGQWDQASATFNVYP